MHGLKPSASSLLQKAWYCTYVTASTTMSTSSVARTLAAPGSVIKSPAVHPPTRVTSGSRTATRFANIAWSRLLPLEGPYGFDLSPDGQRVLHRTTLDDPGVIELYASRVKSSPPVATR